MARLRLGTRGSPLALWQANHVAERLRQAHAGLDVDVEIIRTEGDVRGDVPFGRLQGTGFFVKEIESALREGAVDLAVHSLKDLPTELPPELALSAVLERHDPRDAILSERGWGFEDLPEGTVLATGSPRRRSQLLHARPDLATTAVRGNVDTRLRKLREGGFGALVLALAGVERLGIDAVPVRPVPVSVCLPAVGQGAVAIETRAADSATVRRVAALTHDPTFRAVTAERAFLARLGGGCLAPASAYATVRDGRLSLEGVAADADGKRLLRQRVDGAASSGERLGETLAERLLDAGAGELLQASRESGGERFVP